MRSVLFSLVVAVVLEYYIAKSATTPATLTDYEFQKENDGSYHFHYTLSDGTSRYENGYISKERNVISIRGNYSYQSPDGIRMFRKYSGDERGFSTGMNADLKPITSLEQNQEQMMNKHKIPITAEFFRSGFPLGLVPSLLGG